MFLIFNVDYMFEGMSAGIEMILKVAILVGIITPPVITLIKSIKVIVKGETNER